MELKRRRGRFSSCGAVSASGDRPQGNAPDVLPVCPKRSEIARAGGILGHKLLKNANTAGTIAPRPAITTGMADRLVSLGDCRRGLEEKRGWHGTRKEDGPLIIAVCIDGRGGVLFNRRRQSQDRVQREDLLRFCGGRRLWIAPYSAPLFDGREGVQVDEDFLSKAEDGEVCFVEDRLIAPFAERIEAVVLYDWNRAYPADVHLDFDPAAAGFTLAEETEFPGSSHERIIRKIYKREADHGEEET